MNALVVVVVGVTTLVQALVTMSALIPSAIAPDMAQAFAVPAAFVGYQIALVYGGGMATSVIGGAVVRRFGACRTSQMALAFCVLGLALAVAGTVIALVAGSLLVGLGYGLVNPASSHLLEKCTPPRNRNLVFSIKQTGVPLGGILAGLLAPPLAVTLDWRWAFAVTAVACAVIMLLLQFARAGWDADREPQTAMLRTPFEGLRLIWRTAVLRHLSLAALCFAATQLCLTSFIVALLVEDMSVSLVAAGAVLSAVQASGFAGRVAWGWLADRLGDGLGVLAGLTAITLAGCVATALVGPNVALPLVTGLLVVFGFAAIGWNGVYLAEVARAAPAGRIGSATGGSLVFTFGGVLAGPPAFTLAHGAMGSFTTTFGLLTIVPLAGLAFVLLARRDRRAAALRTSQGAGKIAQTPDDRTDRASP